MSLLPENFYEGRVVDGRWRITRSLRQRSASWSFVASDLRRTGRLVVMRLLRLPPETPPETSRREVVLLGVSHPHILRYEAFHESIVEGFGDQLFVAVRSYGTTTLSKLVRSALSLKEVESSAVSILDALVFLHERKIVQGELRPSNVVVTDGHYSVTDFSLVSLGAERLSGPAEHLHRDLAYVAPEFLSASEVTAAGDAYAFGALLFHLFATEPLEAKVRRPTQIRALLRGDLAAKRRSMYAEVITTCLEADPRNRPTLGQLRPLLAPNWDGAIESAIRSLNSPLVQELALGRLEESLRGWRFEEPPNLGAAFERALAGLRADIHVQPWLCVRCVHDSRAAEQVARRTLYELGAQPHPHRNDVPEGHSFTTRGFGSYDPPDDIDDEWLQEILRRHETPPEAFDASAVESLSDIDRSLAYPTASEVVELIRKECASASAQRQTILSEPFLLSEDVVRLVARSSPLFGASDLDDLVASGTVIALRDHGRRLYPSFQFHPTTGRPFVEIRLVSALLDPNASPWGVVSWWRRPHQALGLDAPRDWLGRGRSAELLEAAELSLGRERRNAEES